jgi:hypothetical protein
MDHLNAVGEITEMIYIAAETEKYAHLGAVAAITEELYFATHCESERGGH